MANQLSPRPSQLDGNEPSLVRSSSSIEDVPELQQLNSSLSREDRADENEDFQLTPPRLSIPIGTEEKTGRSIEIRRRALDDKPLGSFCRSSLGTVRGSDRFDEISALGFDDISRHLKESVSQIATSLDKEDVGVRVEESNLESVLI